VIIKRLALGAGAVGLLGTLFLGGGLYQDAPPLVGLGNSSVTSQSACLVSPDGDGGSVAKAAYSAGFRGNDLVIAVAVSHAESGWNPTATNANSNGSIDYGLWQINSVHAALLSHGNWRDPDFNASVAFQIWSEAHGWAPWVTFWDGSYEQYMGVAATLVDALTAPTAACAPVAAGALVDPGNGPQAPGDMLRPRAEEVKADTMATWGCASIPAPCISAIEGYAPRMIAGTKVVSDHATGRAVDLMLGSDYRSPVKHQLGEQIANYWATHLSQFGGHYVIFDKRIFTSESSRWAPYVHPSGGHNDTLDHVNHIHVSVK
jgi:hypothetical protein